jgi:hypothetical protein
MNTKLALRGGLIVIGILSLVYISAGLTHSEKTKARAQRIRSVNAAPRVVISSTLSNTTAQTSTLPRTGK